MASPSSIDIHDHCDLKTKAENVKNGERKDEPIVHDKSDRESKRVENEGMEERVNADRQVSEEKPNEEISRIGRSLESMEAQMGLTNRLLEQLLVEVKGMREDMKASKAKEAQIASARFDKLLGEEVRNNDLVEKALFAEPSANLFSNSKDRHPHKGYLRSILEDLEVIKKVKR